MSTLRSWIAAALGVAALASAVRTVQAQAESDSARSNQRAREVLATAITAHGGEARISDSPLGGARVSISW